MNIQSPDMSLLRNIYALYHETIAEVDQVCDKKCVSCCTCNVTLTSLEMKCILSSLNIQTKKEFQIQIQQKFPGERYIPKMTTNRFARLCMENKDIPEEENDPAFGTCPLLEDDLCTIYELRPFGCRALMSQIRCGKEGYASVPPLVLTLNTIFLQVIEHLDQKGFSGNLSDMAVFFLSDYNRPDGTDRYKDTSIEGVFVHNEKIPLLMIPPEHRQELSPLIGKIFKLLKI